MAAHVSPVLGHISSRLFHRHRVVTLTSSSCCLTIFRHHKWKRWTRVDDYDYNNDALLLPNYSIRLFQSLPSYLSSPTAWPSKRTSPKYRSPVHRLSKLQKSVATILCIRLLFSLCFLPYVVSAGVLQEAKVQQYSNFALLLLFLSSSLNTGLYLWRMKDIRNGVKHLLCKSSWRISGRTLCFVHVSVLTGTGL